MDNALRGLFPVLSGDITYLDSAAKSLTPTPVVDAMRMYYERLDANTERGLHTLSARSTELVETARQAVAGLVGAGAGEIVLLRNTSEAINQVASGLDWKPGDRVVVTMAEHHSNYLPWMRAAGEHGLEFVPVRVDEDGTVRLESMREAIRGGRTRLVSCTQVSNALGTLQPVQEICGMARDAGALSLIDGAQSVPHLPVSVRELGCDFLAWSGHKMFGPTGTGALWGREELLAGLRPACLGGGTVADAGAWAYDLDRDPPYTALECGSPDVAGIAGFGEAARLLKGWMTAGSICRVQDLVHQTAETLRSIPGVVVFGPRVCERRVGVVSFAIDGFTPHAAALELDAAYSIAVRSGHQCALPLMREVLGRPEGVVRASFHLYSNQADADALAGAVKELASRRPA